jgi:uncharacterized protein YeaO (DUF488 family)
VYDTLSDGDGLLILVDRIWSRGMSKVTLIFGAKEEHLRILREEIDPAGIVLRK